MVIYVGNTLRKLNVGHHFFNGKKDFFIKDSHDLLPARDKVSDKVPDEIDEADKLANNIYSTLVDIKSLIQKNLYQNKFCKKLFRFFIAV